MAREIKPIFSQDRVGTEFNVESPWYNGKVFVGMPGKFNVYNALSAIACAGIMGIAFESVTASLSDITVSGRVQPVKTGRNFQVVVDYAHNAASLENVLKTLRDYVTGRLICVFGCGGDRAKSRRFEMGETSGMLSDLTIITSDNPRTEHPDSILSDIETGIRKTSGEYLKVPDRTEAIRTAILMAKSGDVILIAGKGHETYQIFADKTIHYDDVEVAKGIIGELNSRTGM
jgi:UDP-N-acetylmuramoyl-L-alanyl-D-glutamate--2,6-diaminopimelate ligase